MPITQCCTSLRVDEGHVVCTKNDVISCSYFGPHGDACLLASLLSSGVTAVIALSGLAAQQTGPNCLQACLPLTNAIS